MTHPPLPLPSRKRGRLLGGSAICGAAALFVQPALAGAILPPSALPDAASATTAFGALGPGGSGVGAAPGFTTAPNLLTVDVRSSRSIITWDSFNVGSASTVAFGGMSAGDIAVNRATSRMVIEGSVTGGGALWFLSPGGVLVNGGNISAAGGVLMSNGTLNEGAFLGSGDLSGAMAAIQGSAALISMGDVTPADTAEVALGGDIVLSSSATLTVETAKGGAVSLTATGEVDAGVLTATAGDLTVQGSSIAVSAATAAGKLTLQGPVVVGAGGSTLTAGGQVSLTSTVDGPGDLTISTPGQTTIADDIGATTPLASLTVGAGPLLFKGAAITATGDVTLHGVSLGGAGAVVFSAGGAFEAGDISGATADLNDLAITAGSTLTLGGIGHSGRLKSASFAGGGPIALKGDISALNEVDFLSAAALTGSGTRRITAGGATFQAVAMAKDAILSADVGSGAASFNGAVGTAGSSGTRLAVRAGTATFAATNRISTLAASIASGGLDFTNSRTLSIGAVDGVAGVRATAGDVALHTSAGALSLTSGISTASSAQVSLSAAGAISQSGGAIKTGVLLAEAGGAISLTQANHFSHLGATSAPGQSISIVDADALTIDGPVAGKSISLSGAGLTFTSLNAEQNLTLDATSGALTGASGAAASGDLKLTGATIVLNGAATAGRDLVVKATGGGASLGSVSAGQDAGLTASGALGVAGAVSAGRDYAVTAQDFVGAALAASPGRDLTIVDTGGALTAGALTASRNLSITAQGGGALTVSGALTATSGDIALTTTGGGALTLGANVTTGAGRTTTLVAGGAILQSGGVVSTGTITGASAGGFSLDKANTFSRLGSVTNTGAGGVDVVDASALTLDGPLDGGSGGVSVTGAAVSFATLTSPTSLTLAATAGDITGAGAATTTGDLVLSGRSVNISGPLVAANGGVKVTASHGMLSVSAVTAAKDILLRDTDLGAGTAGDGGSITAGPLTAGADVGVASADGGVTLASVSAGDDVAIRALYGRVTVTGDVKSGRDMPGVTRTDDPGGAADGVVAGANFPDFDPASTTDFVLKGHDVDIQAQAIKVTGAIVAGVQQPGGDNPDAATLRDTTPSDVRLRSGGQSLATAGLAASILVGDVTATRDIQIDSRRGVDAGALKAGQDVAVLARGLDETTETDPLSHGLGATIGSAAAGRHVVMYSVWGRNHVLGPVTAHHSYPQFQPDSTGDTSDGAAERLAAYIRYLDLDDASRPFISGAGDVVVVGRGVDLDGAVAAAGSVRIQSGSSLAQGPGDTIRLGGLATATTGDVRLQAFGADSGPIATITTGGLTAGGDVAVWSRNGGAALGALSATDDVAIRAARSVAVSGTISAGSGLGTGPGGGADQLVLASKGGALTLSGHRYDVATVVGSVDVKGQDINISGSTTAASSARLQASAGVTTGAVTAAVGDVLIDAGGAVGTGALSAGRDVGVRSTGAISDVAIASATAGDDVVLRGEHAIRVNGALSAGSGADSAAADQAGDLMAGADAITLQGHSYGVTGGDIDLKARAIAVAGGSTAMSDARFQAAGAIATGDVAATEADVLADAGGAISMGRLSAGRDVGIRSTGATSDVVIASAAAGDDVVLRSVQAVQVDGALSAGGADAATADQAGDQAGDLMAGADAVALAGQSYGLSGGDIDLKAGTIVVNGVSTAGSDARFQADRAITTGDVAAAEADVLADAGGAISMGRLSAGRDVGIRSTGATSDLVIASAAAGDDVVLRGEQAIQVDGALSAAGADSAAADQAGDLLAGADAVALAGQSYGLSGGDIDLKAGTIAVTGVSTAGSDARFQAAGAIATGDVAATEADVLADAGGAISMGRLSAGGDVGVRSSGAGVALDQASAGDDIVLRAAGDISAAGTLSAAGAGESEGVGDLIFSADRSRLSADFGLSGANIDVKTSSGGVTLSGAAAASVDVRVQTVGSGGVHVAAVTAGRDILLDGGGADSVRAGDLAAGGDIALRGRDGGVNVGSAAAGDDLVVRAAGAFAALGALTANGGSDVAGAGDQLVSVEGAINVAGRNFDLTGNTLDVRGAGVSVGADATAGADVRLQSTGAIALAGVTGGRDVLIDATGAVRAGAIAADRDVALRSTGAGVTLDRASAGDDLVLRGAGGVQAAGALVSKGTADGDGAADALFGADRTSLSGDFDLAGSDVDIRSANGPIVVGGAISAARDARLQTAGDGAVQVAAVTAGRDILLDGASATAGAVEAASGDVAVRARTGGVALQSAAAGDDIILRSAQDVTVSGGLTSGPADAAGAGDRLLAASGAIRWAADSAALDQVSSFDSSGGAIDVRGGGRVSVGGAVQASGPSARFETPGELSLASITAGRLIFVRASGLTIGGDWRASTVRIEATSPTGLVLGDGASAPAGAAILTNAQFNKLDADTVQIFAGDTSGAMRGAGLAIGALSVDLARIRSRLELYAGSNADVLITRAFAPSTEAANSTLLRIGAADATVGNWTPRSIRIIADDGGSIGQSTTTDGRIFTGVRAFGAVELNARESILMGYQSFIDRLATATPDEVPALVRALSAPQGENGPLMLLTAGSLSLRAGRIGQQDTSNPTSLTRTGIYINGPLFLGTTEPGANAVGPELIELSGAINNGSVVLVNESAALTNLINLNRPDPYYRLNSCVILQTGACSAQGGTPDTGFSPNRLTTLQLIDPQDAGVAEDPTVASATNEEIWRDPE
ncbi:hypothetical protein LJR225_001123 [Phenylobacterium sp. LjRoot225]|uniref:beta strand repeat-containing protein n=1 Tax=Phenylobacterium sp. LjRoot225 TaxID=3342285 RepID=UPI003ECE5AD9